MWDLTKQGVPYVWLDKHDKALQGFKQALIQDAMGYFNANWETELHVDASPVGLAAVCTQNDPQTPSTNKIVQCASRLLTDVEKRYSQAEKEGLAVVWACEKFKLYLLGSKFKLITDNRAVQLIYSNPNSKPPARIERWALRLVNFDFEIIHKPGNSNIADYLSRHPSHGEDSETDLENEAEGYVNFIAKFDTPKRVTTEELIEATHKDASLMLVSILIAGGKLSNEETKSIASYLKITCELSVTNEGLVLRGCRLVIPASLQEKTVMIAHEGHLGMTKTKNLLRTKVWFPAMNTMVEQAIGKCLSCQLNTGGEAYEPIKLASMPKEPWDEVAIDFYGPLPNGKELLVLMDERSRMPVLAEVTSTTARYVNPILDEIFSLLGIPTTLKSDNGPPFNGKEYRDFCEYLGIKTRFITPYWPQANGMVEAFMRCLGKVIRASIVQKSDLKQDMNKFLRNYRATPHPATREAPSMMMWNRN